MKQFFKLLRVKHYSKNILVLLPLIFGRRLTDLSLLWKTLLGTAAFCLISSAVYIVNDIRDAEKDRKHPTKRNRPIASGAVSVSAARILIAILCAGALVLNAFACGVSPLPWALLIVYFLLNLGYSMGLKDIAIVDIAILVSGFLLRLLYGSALTGIEISGWLYLTVVTMSFFMGLGKRRNELRVQQSGEAQGETRAVLHKYSFGFLDKSMYMCLALAVAFYSLWCVDAPSAGQISENRLIWTVPLVILICLKYSMTVEGQSDGDPVEVLFCDKWLLGLVALLGCAILGIIYL